MVLNAGYSAELRRGDCPQPFSSCVLFVPPVLITTVRAEELQQIFPAAPYLGKTIRFSGWLQASKPAKGDVELRMRIDHANKKVDFFDSLDGPVTSATWRRREVIGTVSSDVVSISMWARFHQPGPEWFANPSFGIITSPIREATDEENVRAPD